MAAETGQPFSRDSADVAAHGGAIAGLIGRSASISLGVTSPTTMSPQQEKDISLAPPDVKRSSSESGLPPPSPTTPAPVDWDLWQNVVYEGPAAVARTSPEEMEAAIASGIPHPIRGVVWQVLAGSKNEDLERLYDELVARGTDKDKAAANNGHLSLASVSSKDKESIASSASSIHSEHSTPATTAGALSPQVSLSGDGTADEVAKLQNGLMAVKTKASKDEVARIQKLEKVIKRDLGSRTAYSKFEGAKDSEGLFGVCKAYALYDEAVGYAQGMNFIAQPLLLNVSVSSPLQSQDRKLTIGNRCLAAKPSVFSCASCPSTGCARCSSPTCPVSTSTSTNSSAYWKTSNQRYSATSNAAA